MKAFLIGIFTLLAITAFSQKEGNIWYFGDGDGIDWSSGSPVLLTNNGLMYNGMALGTICDSSGKLLFYTNGWEVMDSTHNPMPNSPIHTNNSAGGQLLISPVPGNDSIFYIFTSSVHAGFEDSIQGYWPSGLMYHIVNMKRNNGNGDIISKDNLLFSPSAAKVTAIKHGNGVDIWIIAHELVSNCFRSYKITCDGLDTIPFISCAGSVWCPGGVGDWGNERGFFRPSHNQERIAASLYDAIEIFDFNNSTGVFLNPLFIPNIRFCYIAEFSPNDSLLYFENDETNPGTVWMLEQINLHAGDGNTIFNTRVKLDSVPGNPSLQYRGKRMGPDGIIYVNQAIEYLGTISSPNTLGVGCNYQDSVFALTPGTATNGYGLPHRMNFIPHPWLDNYNFTYADTCVGDTVWFSDASDYTPDSSKWNFGDPGSGILNQSLIVNSFHIYSTPGSYTVTRINYRSCLRDTMIKTITIIPRPQPNLGVDTSFCEGNTISLSGGSGFDTYLWSTSENTLVINISNGGTYSVTVTEYGCSGSDQITVNEILIPQPSIGNDTILCSGNSIILNSNSIADSYSWSTGENTSSIQTSTAGTYWVNAVNTCGNGSDTIEISSQTIPEVNLGADKEICSGENVTLDAGYQSGIIWSNSSTTQSITVSNPGLYWVEVVNGCGQSRDSIELKITGDKNKVIPTFFSPDEDGTEDCWEIPTEFIVKNILLYDRIGRLIWKGDGDNILWCGDVNGNVVTEGIYFYRMEYEDCLGESQEKTGKVFVWR